MGQALAASLRAAGCDVPELAGKGADGLANGTVADAVLLAVPDSQIAAAAALIAPGPLIGHLSGATGLAALGERGGFALHPLTTVTGAESSFAGSYAAVGGTSAAAVAVARDIAGSLGMATFDIADADRAAYHAAASIASNYLGTVAGFAERLASRVGVPRAALAPLARAAIENWERLGAVAAMTGPIARGDEQTVAAQRAAVARQLPGDLAFFDALTEATRALASERAASAEQDPERTALGSDERDEQ